MSTALRSLVPYGVRDDVSRSDLAAVLAVPLVLGGVFVLPAGTRRSLAFEYADPRLATAFVAPYVHFDLLHLSVNVIGYLVVVPTAYALSVASGNRRRFLVAFATFLLAFPGVLSYLNLAVARPSASVGFSGVLLAFVGYLPLAIADHLDEQFGVGPPVTLAPVLFFVGLAVTAALSVRSAVSDPTVLLGTAGLVAATLLSAALFALSTIDRRDGLRRKVLAAPARPGYFELTVLATVLFVTFPFVAFPADPVASGGVLNLYVHLLGYALGFTATYATVTTGDRLSGTESWV